MHSTSIPPPVLWRRPEPAVGLGFSHVGSLVAPLQNEPAHVGVVAVRACTALSHSPLPAPDLSKNAGAREPLSTVVHPSTCVCLVRGGGHHAPSTQARPASYTDDHDGPATGPTTSRNGWTRRRLVRIVDDGAERVKDGRVSLLSLTGDAAAA